MCNLSANIVEESRAEGRAKVIYELVENGSINLATGATALSITEKELVERMEAAGYKVPALA